MRWSALRAITSLGFILFSSVTVAQPVSWVKLTMSANGEYTSYLDANAGSITPLGGKNSWAVWTKLVYSKPQSDGLFSRSFSVENRRYIVRCDDRTMATVARDKFSDSGAAFSRESWPEASWEFRPVGPKGGTNAIEFDSICTLAMFPSKSLDFSESGNWQNAAGFANDSIDAGSVRFLNDTIYVARIRTIQRRDTRIGNTFYRTSIAYTIANCKTDTSGIYAFGFISKQDELVESGLVPFDSIKMQALDAGSAPAGYHSLLCKKPETESAGTISPTEKASTPKGNSSGTGFFVSADGFLLTNNHVVASCKSLAVRTSERDTLPAKLIGTDQKNDLAVLKVEKRVAEFAAFRSRSADMGEPVYVFGYPLSGVLSSGGNATTGIVSALAGLGDDTSKIQISAPVQPGNSGGPLYDKNGLVIGIVVEKLNALAVAKAIGDVPQNVNFAIKSGTASAFLDSLGVKYGVIRPSNPIDQQVIFARARNQSVFIECSQ